MSLDNFVDGLRVLRRPILQHPGKDIGPVINQPGFVAGRYTEFSGDGGLLLSWGALFDTVEHAEQSFALYLTEFKSPNGYGFDGDAAAGLGDEGACDEGEVVIDVTTGATLHEFICLWRIGNAVLAAGGGPADVVRSVAEGMDARAD